MNLEMSIIRHDRITLKLKVSRGRKPIRVRSQDDLVMSLPADKSHDSHRTSISSVPANSHVQDS